LRPSADAGTDNALEEALLAADLRSNVPQFRRARVFLIAFCVVRALREAATARLALMGWEDDAWTAARKCAERIENALFPSRLDERPATTDERAGPQGSGKPRPG
jgi:hypothetical protein